MSADFARNSRRFCAGMDCHLSRRCWIDLSSLTGLAARYLGVVPALKRWAIVNRPDGRERHFCHASLFDESYNPKIRSYAPGPSQVAIHSPCVGQSLAPSSIDSSDESALFLLRFSSSSPRPRWPACRARRCWPGSSFSNSIRTTMGTSTSTNGKTARTMEFVQMGQRPGWLYLRNRKSTRSAMTSATKWAASARWPASRSSRRSYLPSTPITTAGSARRSSKPAARSSSKLLDTNHAACSPRPSCRMRHQAVPTREWQNERGLPHTGFAFERKFVGRPSWPPFVGAWRRRSPPRNRSIPITTACSAAHGGNQQPTTSNQQPATNNQKPETRSDAGSEASYGFAGVFAAGPSMVVSAGSAA